MKYKKLGSSDLEVSEICLGTMTWGNQNTEVEAHEQLSYAVDEAHINFIDTAEAYPIPPEVHLQGKTESYIGSWLAKRGKRDDLVLASKITASNIIQTREWTGHYDKKSIKAAIEGSLARLQTDYLDLYQVHWPERKANFFGPRAFAGEKNDPATAIEETLEALTELVKEGKTRYVGVSNETAWGVSEYLRFAREKSFAKIISIQNQYSLLNRTFEIGLSEFATREDVGLLAYSPLSMGVLSGKYLDGAKPEGARFTLFTRNVQRYNPPHAQDAVAKYVELAKAHGLDPAQMAIAFILTRPFATSAIIGATSMEQLKSDIGSADVVLSEEVLAGIEQIYLEHPDPHA